MATWSATVRPPDLPWNTVPSPRCAALVPGLFVRGQEGGITPGMIPYYWAFQPFRLGLVLLAGSGFILLPVLPPLSWSLWCPHTLTTRLQQNHVLDLVICSRIRKMLYYVISWDLHLNTGFTYTILQLQWNNLGICFFSKKKIILALLFYGGGEDAWLEGSQQTLASLENLRVC